MKFYTIDQNNSGGYYIQNDFVDHLVCIQSSSSDLASKHLESIVEDHSSYCGCCGERWCIWLGDKDGTDFISNSYGDNLETMHPDDVYEYGRFVIVYYANGDKKKFDAKTKEFVDLGKWI